MTETSTRTDQETIHAVRSGELDRFRELIERYEGQVYAVAWSRLGDASLAEEVVQESFIKAYRYLGWLRDPSRFGAWLTRIARGLAINFGIRHRRELNRRERWALDPSRLASHDGTPPEPSAVSDGALREALADLSATHRECLVLHYLEGHSIQDAAQALGITGGAFKVRLHRARAALRESIEAHLGESLGRLGPRTSQVSAIMAALPGVGSAGAGTGLIASLGAAVAKLIPAPWIALVLPMISAAFGVGAAAWMMSAERRNYRKPSDFRARLHQRATVRALIITALLMLFITAGGVAWVDPIRPLHILLAVGMALWLAGLRLLQLNRRPEMVAQALSALPMWIVLLVGQFVPVPPWWLPIAQLLFFGAMAFSFRARPLRFDYNLFLRGAKRMLPPGSGDHSRRPLTIDEIMAFGRLLGSNWLVNSYRRQSTSCTFGLTPVDFSPWQMAWPFIRRHGSRLTLGTDGSVTSHLGAGDRAAIEGLLGSSSDASEIMESEVTKAVSDAWIQFRNGQPSAALKSLGETSETEIFVTPPNASRAFKIQRAVLIGGALAALLLAVYQIRQKPWDAFRRVEVDLVPVRLTLEEAKASLGSLGMSRDAESARLWRELHAGLTTSDVLPPGAWFRTEGLSRLRSNLLWSAMRGHPDVADAVDRALGDSRLHKAFRFGWITTNDLAAFGVTQDSIVAMVNSWSPAHRTRQLDLEDRGVVGRTNVTVLGVEDLRWRLEFLRAFDCLHLVPRDSIVETLLAHQVKRGRALPAGRRPDLDQTEWEGFFATMGWSPIHETAEALRVLAMLGAIDRVDRAACTRALVRLHRGNGVLVGRNQPFEFPSSTPALTTFEAREALRLLGTSDQVPDFADWEFRIRRSADSTPDNGEIRQINWAELEAVLVQDADRALKSGHGVESAP